MKTRGSLLVFEWSIKCDRQATWTFVGKGKLSGANEGQWRAKEFRKRREAGIPKFLINIVFRPGVASQAGVWGRRSFFLAKLRLLVIIFD